MKDLFPLNLFIENSHRKTHRTQEQFIEILFSLKEIITSIPEEEFVNFIDLAENISPDEKDVTYFALALKLKCPIWSNDKKLKEQGQVKVLNTKEIIELIL